MKKVYITPRIDINQLLIESVMGDTDSHGWTSGQEALSKETDVFEWDDAFSGDIWSETDNSLENDPWGNNE